MIAVLSAPRVSAAPRLGLKTTNTHFLRLLSVTTQGTSSSLQFVHGAPCSTTLQRTFRALQHWHALLARRFTGRPLLLAAPRPALLALRFGPELGEEWPSEAEGEFGSWFSCAACGSGVMFAVGGIYS